MQEARWQQQSALCQTWNGSRCIHADGNLNRDTLDLNEIEGVSSFKVKHVAEQHLAKKGWREAADDNKHGGYEHGKPLLQAADKAHKKFMDDYREV